MTICIVSKKKGVAVATLVEELVLPTKKSKVIQAFQTINAQFILKVRLLFLFIIYWEIHLFFFGAKDAMGKESKNRL